MQLGGYQPVSPTSKEEVAGEAFFIARRNMKVCEKCGGTTFYARGQCKECQKNKSAEYRFNNIEKVRSSLKKWQLANLDYFRKSNKKYYESNKDKIKVKCKQWAENNKEKIKLIQKKHKDANKDRHRIESQNRRAKQRENGGKLSKGLKEKLFKLQHGKCACCGKPLGADYHLDHIMPIALGGANEDWNIQLLISTCNHQKIAKHPIDFMQSRGFLL